MKFVTLIPLRLNDGTPVDQGELDAIQRDLWQRFGGLTIEGVVEGHWIDGGRHYQDENLKVSVVCESERIVEAIEAVRAIGRRLGQVAMYFEVTDSGVAFLRV